MAGWNATMTKRILRFHVLKLDRVMDGMCKMGGQAMMLDDIVKKMSKFVLACNQMLDNRF